MSFFSKGKINSTIFSSGFSNIKSEPDIRSEVTKIIEEEKRGSWLIYRRTRRDLNRNPILATGSSNTRSAEALPFNNEGMKYLFDDYLIKGYIARDMTYHETGKVKQYGDSRTDVIAIFIEWDVLFKQTKDNTAMPDELDQIIIPDYDLDGNMISPIRVRETHKIGSVEPYRLDHTGRIEFFRLNILTDFDKSNRL